MITFIDGYRDRFGVEPICRTLTAAGWRIAPSTYYAARTRLPSQRAVRDAQLLPEIVRVHADRNLGRGLYGARKVWHQLKREGHRVSRCQVERLMRSAGLRGARRGSKPFTTTRPDEQAVRPPDLVDRLFRAGRRNELWVVDFTYVATWSGMAFTAFVTDVFSRRIVGWRCHASMSTALPLDALEMALWTRQRTGENVAGLIHHSDAGSQGTPPSATATGSPTPAPSRPSAVSATATTTPWPRPSSGSTRPSASATTDRSAASTTSSSPL